MVCCLPRRWLYALGAGLGNLIWWCLPVRREVARTNLVLCFPGKSAQEQLRLGRKHFKSLGIGVVESLTAWSGRERYLLGCLEWGEGSLELLAAVHAEGRGLLMLGTHFTTLDLACAALRRVLPNVVYAYRNQSQPLVDALMHVGRARSGRSPGIQRFHLRNVLRALEQNHIVWYAIDQDVGSRHSVFVPFFGVPTATSRYIGGLVRHTRAPVCLLWYRRLPDYSGYQITLKQLALDGDAERNATLINTALEQAILQAPEQYFWVHRRFKTRPAGQPPVYASRR